MAVPVVKEAFHLDSNIHRFVRVYSSKATCRGYILSQGDLLELQVVEQEAMFGYGPIDMEGGPCLVIIIIRIVPVVDRHDYFVKGNVDIGLPRLL